MYISFDKVSIIFLIHLQNSQTNFSPLSDHFQLMFWNWSKSCCFFRNKIIAASLFRKQTTKRRFCVFSLEKHGVDLHYDSVRGWGHRSSTHTEDVVSNASRKALSLLPWEFRAPVSSLFYLSILTEVVGQVCYNKASFGPSDYSAAANSIFFQHLLKGKQ